MYAFFPTGGLKLTLCVDCGRRKFCVLTARCQTNPFETTQGIRKCSARGSVRVGRVTEAIVIFYHATQPSKAFHFALVPLEHNSTTRPITKPIVDLSQGSFNSTYAVQR